MRRDRVQRAPAETGAGSAAQAASSFAPGAFSACGLDAVNKSWRSSQKFSKDAVCTPVDGGGAEPAGKLAFYGLKSSKLKYVFLATIAARLVLVSIIGFWICFPASAFISKASPSLFCDIRI